MAGAEFGRRLFYRCSEGMERACRAARRDGLVPLRRCFGPGVFGVYGAVRLAQASRWLRNWLRRLSISAISVASST